LRIRAAETAADVEPRRIPSTGEVWVDDRLLRRLAIKIGERIVLGEREFTVAAMVSEEPESSVGFMNLGPRLMFNMDDLASTALVQAGSRVSYRLFVAGDTEAVAGFRDYAARTIRLGQR